MFLVMPLTAAFAAEYAMPATPRLPMDETLTIEPSPRFSMSSSTYLHIQKVPYWSILTT